MTRHLVVFEDARWRDLRPLTDVLPVPAVAFGASTLALRWMERTALPLAALVGRGPALRAWTDAPPPRSHPAPGDEILAVNAAVLPGRWLDQALAADAPARFESGGRIAAVRAPFERLREGLSRGEHFEGFARELPIRAIEIEARVLAYPWHLLRWNAEAIEEDLAHGGGASEGSVHPLAALLEPDRIAIGPGARIDPFAVLDARGGPIRIEGDAVVLPHTVVVGPCVVGRATQLLSGYVSRSTIGPECRIAGEVEECIWQGYANKRHHGFVGHSLIGEWVNLGALTTTSDLKNNYGSVRVWVDGREVDSGSPKVGSLIGAHVKTGIGTLLPTGASLGVGSNLFGGGRFAPKHVPPFSWWDGERMVEHRLDPFLQTARVATSRRGRSLDSQMEAFLRALHADTARERSSSSPGLVESLAAEGRSGGGRDRT